jgi:hypothetical protein
MAGYSQVMVHLSHFAVHFDAILDIEQAWFIAAVMFCLSALEHACLPAFASAAVSVGCYIH